MTTLRTPLTPTGTPWVRNASLLAGLATFALCIHAAYVDVVIHPIFFTAYCFVAMLIPGGALTVFLLFRNATQNPPVPLGRGGIIGPLVLPFLIGAILWVVLAKTPAWFAAGLFGPPHSEIREFYIRTGGRKSGCRSRAVVTDDLRLMPSHLCVSGTFASQYYHQRVHLRLIGKRTPLGFRITHIEHVDVLDPASSRSPTP